MLSHPHRDHVELLADVIDGYDVANVWDPGAINPICGYRRFIEAVSAKPSVAYHSGAQADGVHLFDFTRELCPRRLRPTVNVEHAAPIVEGSLIPLGRAASMTFLHVDGTRHAGDKFNENSLVTLLDLGSNKVLLMGDAEAGGRADPMNLPTEDSVEGYVLRKYPERLRADVLIAGHHGSKSSSRMALVNAVKPKISVISSGPMKYGSVVLPDAEIVTALKRVSELFRTDLNDAACAQNPHKIGPDADGRPGGCDNVQIRISGGEVSGAYARLAD